MPTSTPGLRDGTIDGYEKGLRIYQVNQTSWLAPYVTANVNLWPHTVALFANPDTLADLTPTQRGWLDEAGADAAARSTDLTDDDATSSLSSARAAPGSPTPPTPTWPR